MVVPISAYNTEVIIRNSISNVNMSISSNFDFPNFNGTDKANLLNNVINGENYEYPETNNIVKLKTLEPDPDQDPYDLVITRNRSTHITHNDRHIVSRMNDNNYENSPTVESPAHSPTYHIKNRERVIRNHDSMRISLERIMGKSGSFSSNLVFEQLITLISEKDFKFYMLENNKQIEDYIKSLDNTPVYYTYNCGIIFIPPKSKKYLSFRQSFRIRRLYS